MQISSAWKSFQWMQIWHCYQCKWPEMDLPHLGNRWHHNGTDGNGEERKTTRKQRDLGRKLGIWREAEALGKQSLVFEAKAWKSWEFVLQHSPGLGLHRSSFRCSHTHLAHLELLPALPSPTCPAALPQGQPEPGHCLAQGALGVCSPPQGTTLQRPLPCRAEHTGAGCGSS